MHADDVRARHEVGEDRHGLDAARDQCFRIDHRVVRHDVRSTERAQAFGDRTADGAGADQTDLQARHLAPLVALLRDAPVDHPAAGADVVVGFDDPSEQREHEADRQLGDGVRVPAGGADDDDTFFRRRRHVDVVGIAAAHAEILELALLEDFCGDVIGFDDQHGDALEPFDKLLGRMQLDRHMVVPRVDLQVAERAQQIDAGTSEGREREDSQHGRESIRPRAEA